MAAFDQFPGEDTEPEIMRKLLDGRSQLWIAWDDEAGEVIGGALTCIYEYARFKALQITALGGRRFEDWRQAIDDTFTAFASVHGAQRVEFHGRRGWERRLPNYGVHRIMMTRDL